MSEPLAEAFRAAGLRVVAALAARFRDLDLAEEAFARACLRGAERWPRDGAPRDAAAWLFRVAERCALDLLRRRRVREPLAQALLTQEPPIPWPKVEATHGDRTIPDERLRLIFVCCHPALAPDARAALTLRVVCGLSTEDIARAFFVPTATLAQRLVRAKRKIAEAGIPFAVPRCDAWPLRMDAVLSTLEIAYAKAHEDAAGGGAYAGYASEMLDLTRVLAELAPDDAEVLGFAALVRFAEARRPARLGAGGAMLPLSEQDPALWCRPLIAEGNRLLARALRLAAMRPRVLQASIHGLWSNRESLAAPPPWSTIVAVYDAWLAHGEDPIVRLNRAVALAETQGAEAALAEVTALDADSFASYVSYHAVRADLLRRTGRAQEARHAYDAALALDPPPAERLWLMAMRRGV